MAVTTWGPGNTVNTTLDRLSMDIPKRPEFWDDMGTMVRRLRPQPSAAVQRQALSAPVATRPAPRPMPTEQNRGPVPSKPDYGAITPRSLGRFQMNHTGNWGTFVNPADIPAALQDTIMGGFYGEPGNWDTSNPSILGPQQWKGRGAQAVASASR